MCLCELMFLKFLNLYYPKTLKFKYMIINMKLTL